MINEILGKKIGMTQVFGDNGARIPVTIIEAGPSSIVQRKTVENDGYCAVQLGFVDIDKKRLNRPRMMHFKSKGVQPKRFLREVRLTDSKEAEGVEDVKVDMFSAGDRVDVVGVTKGRGFAGVFKRYNAGGAPASRGAHEAYRHIGSLGGGQSRIRRVWLGKKLPGHMGCENKTVLNLEVVQVIKGTNHLLVKGAVPGANGGMLCIKKTKR